VPTTIPRENYLRTTIRLQHLGGLTVERRQARWEKYREADPDLEWEPDYEYTRDPVGAVLRWPTRDPELPVVRWPAPSERVEDALAALDLDGPVLSVAVVDEPGPRPDPNPGEAAIAMLDRLAAEPCAEPVELLLVTADVTTARRVERARPAVVVVVADRDAPPGMARNAALKAAKGDYVTFLPVPSPISPGVLDAVVQAHDRGAAMVAGAAAATDADPVGLAARLLEFTPFDGSPRISLPAPCASFAREALLDAGGFAEDVGVGIEAIATRGLTILGFTEAVVPSLLIGGRTTTSSTGRLLRERFQVGRAAARLTRAEPQPVGDTIAAVRGVVDQVRRSRVVTTRDGGDRARAGTRVQAVLAAGAAATGLGAAAAAWGSGSGARR
jgi:hypothetical protein